MGAKRGRIGVDPARLDEIAEDLNEVLASGDPSLLAAALGELAREFGMREVAAAAGLSREALYKALRRDAQPRFDTINRVCGALGVTLYFETSSVTPSHSRGQPWAQAPSRSRKTRATGSSG